MFMSGAGAEPNGNRKKRRCAAVALNYTTQVNHESEYPLPRGVSESRHSSEITDRVFHGNMRVGMCDGPEFGPHAS